MVQIKFLLLFGLSIMRTDDHHANIVCRHVEINEWIAQNHRDLNTLINLAGVRKPDDNVNPDFIKRGKTEIANK